MVVISLLLGLLYGFAWATFVVLPIFYGIPRSTVYAIRGWARWTMPLYYAAIACFWVGVFGGAFILAYIFAPDLTDSVADDTFRATTTIGFVWFLASCVTKTARRDMNYDFLSMMITYATPHGRALLHGAFNIEDDQQAAA